MRNTILSMFLILLVSGNAYAEIYKIQPGDNLISIARRYNTTAKELMILNNLTGDLIRAGYRIRVPDIQNNKLAGKKGSTPQKTGLMNLPRQSVVAGQAPTSVNKPKAPSVRTTASVNEKKVSNVSATASATHSNTEVTLKVPRRIFIAYKVKSGDTLLGLARRFQTTVGELKRINSIKTDIINIGRVLKVPSYRMEEVRLLNIEMVVDTNVFGGNEMIDTRPFQLVSLAREYEGTPYRRGGESPLKVDCSGFVRMLFSCFDILLPRTSRDQFGVGKEVETITVGDLLFFATRGARRVNHVGIYIGDEKFIHASSAKGRVVVSPLSKYYKDRFKGARRIWEIFAQQENSVDE